MTFGANTRQMIDLYNDGTSDYGIGVQSSTLYERAGAGGGFAWYAGGVHNDGLDNAGGGNTLMLLSAGGMTVNTTVSASGFIGDGSGITNANAATLGGLDPTNFWQLGGNNVSAGQFLGSTNNQPLELMVNGARALRLEPNITKGTANVIGGSSVNFVAAGTVGAVIAGGGATNFQGLPSTNSISADLSSIGGGGNNTIQVSSYESVIGGGGDNTIQSAASGSTIGGGINNIIHVGAADSTIAGGLNNTIQTNTIFAAGDSIGGGGANTIQSNVLDSVISGGGGNTVLANAYYGTIPGGDQNVATYNAFAAGHRAKAVNTGAFVWADSQNADFASTANDQFLIRASGGFFVNNYSIAASNINTAGFYAPNVGPNHSHIQFGSKGDWYIRSSTNTGVVILQDTGGNVGIGTTTPGYPLEVFGLAHRSDNVATWATTSDRRLKTGIKPIQNGLDTIRQVNPVSFVYTDAYKSKNPGLPNARQFSIVAQEYQQIFPDFVTTNNAGYLTVDVSPLTFFNTAAIKELNAKLNEKDAQIQDLKQSVADLKKLVQSLAEKK
jgi:hypothetical protein